MLLNFSHNMRELLDHEALDAGSWQVKRVEEYIEAHLDAPFDIAPVAEVTGTFNGELDQYTHHLLRLQA